MKKLGFLTGIIMTKHCVSLLIEKYYILVTSLTKLKEKMVKIIKKVLTIFINVNKSERI